MSRVTTTVGVATDAGGRPNNEDAAWAEGRLFVVADGMGGHEQGEVASATAISSLVALSDAPGVDEVVVRDAIRRAHEAVRDLPHGRGRRPGTTLTGVVVAEHGDVPCWLVLNVGDSRTYRMAGGVLEQVTHDHSEVAELVERGLILPDEAAHHPRRNVVTRVLGGGAFDVDPDLAWLPVSPGDRILVCSDGLTDALPDARIEAELKAAEDPQEAADRLVAAALAADAQDNVTVIVVDATLTR
jgi:PPM family protein phosphatase